MAATNSQNDSVVSSMGLDLEQGVAGVVVMGTPPDGTQDSKKEAPASPSSDVVVGIHLAAEVPAPALSEKPVRRRCCCITALLVSALLVLAGGISLGVLLLRKADDSNDGMQRLGSMNRGGNGHKGGRKEREHEEPGKEQKEPKLEGVLVLSVENATDAVHNSNFSQALATALASVLEVSANNVSISKIYVDDEDAESAGAGRRLAAAPVDAFFKIRMLSGEEAKDLVSKVKLMDTSEVSAAFLASLRGLGLDSVLGLEAMKSWVDCKGKEQAMGESFDKDDKHEKR